jgi:hypothetical protein
VKAIPSFAACAAGFAGVRVKREQATRSSAVAGACV